MTVVPPRHMRERRRRRLERRKDRLVLGVVVLLLVVGVGYAALWLGGRLYAGWHREQASSLLVLVPTMMVSALVCQVFTSGGFYWFSGRYAEPTFVGMIERLAHYYPSYLSTMAAYVAVAVVLYVGARSAAALFGNSSQRA